MVENITILGVRIDNFSVREIKEKNSIFLENSPEQKFIVTLNSEILLKAHRDDNYRDILNTSDLNICDGFGIKLISLLKGRKIKTRYTGADLVVFLLELAEKKGQKTLVIAAKNSLSSPEEIVRAIKRKYPHLSIKSEYFVPGQNNFSNGIIKQAEIVFVNFGAPAQEKFIFENRMKFPNAKILVGVGGAFDFLTGKIRRAPQLMRLFGLEWLWRLAQEPKRFRRICNAVVVFPTKALRNP
jgi:N-acetylglucosaminyldiphosphoundecaprenol N-acetyl-beta-D-mannosaminyltransferase